MRLKSSVTKKITAVIIVLAMNLVGSLLISALVVFPALSAMRLCRSFRGVTVCSAVFAVCCAFSGIIEDATACCAQGIEFVLPEEFVFPDDYPKPGESICVVGEFTTYTEHGTEYCTLKNAKLIEGGV